MTENNNAQFHDVLKDFDTAMLITRFEEKLYARPMAVAFLEENSDLWFVSGETTEKISEILADPRVHVTCQRDHGSYLSLSGTATISHDQKKIKELWKESFRVWFPKGTDDPNLTLIHVKAEQGEYWDNRGTNKIKYLFSALAAYATGTTPQVEEGKAHGEVSL